MTGLERRLREAARLGFTRAVVPPGAAAAQGRPIAGIAVPHAYARAALGMALGSRAWRSARRPG